MRRVHDPRAPARRKTVALQQAVDRNGLDGGGEHRGDPSLADHRDEHGERDVAAGRSDHPADHRLTGADRLGMTDPIDHAAGNPRRQGGFVQQSLAVDIDQGQADP